MRTEGEKSLEQPGMGRAGVLWQGFGESKGIWVNQVSRAPPPRGVRAEAKGQESKDNDTFVCNLFLISHKHDLRVTKAWLSCQAIPGAPKNTSEVIPSKAQNPEIERASNSPVTGLARPKGCGYGHLQLPLKGGKSRMCFPKSWGEMGMDMRNPLGWKHISLPPLPSIPVCLSRHRNLHQSVCCSLTSLEPSPPSTAATGVGAWAREGAPLFGFLDSNPHQLSDLIFLNLCPGFPGFTTPISVSSLHLGEIGKVGMVITGKFFLFFGRQLPGPRDIIKTLDCRPGPCSSSWWGGGEGVAVNFQQCKNPNPNYSWSFWKKT